MSPTFLSQIDLSWFALAPTDRSLPLQVHVYRVSPVLTSIEKQTSRQLATLFGLEGEYAGGLTQPGGSAANCTAMITARNNLFPDTKLDGCSTRKFVVFTSAHSHYSIDTAAQMSGIGLASCLKVPVDSEGRMMVSELDRMIQESRLQGLTPFFVNATAGTTVRGAFDPLLAIGQLCRQEGLWFHVDASWGGCVAFSSRYRGKLIGSELANSLTVNPHKMINVPVTCSFLLGKDLRCFWLSNSLPAGYLFHENGFHHDKGLNGQQKNGYKLNQHNGTPKSPSEVWDLASLSLQCGRRGDALKLALGWMYYGTSGYGTQIDNAFDTAAYFADRVTENKYLVLVGSNPPPCLQVCFYYAPNGSLGADPAQNTENTRRIADSLVSRGFKVDHAPGERGEFLRPVVHMNVTKQVVDTLIGVVLDIGLTLT